MAGVYFQGIHVEIDFLSEFKQTVEKQPTSPERRGT